MMTRGKQRKSDCVLMSQIRRCLELDLQSYCTQDDRLCADRSGTQSFWPDISVSQAASLALLRSIDKKFVGETEELADFRALSKFTACNAACEGWQLPQLSEKDSWLIDLFGDEMRGFFYQHRDGTWLLDDYYAIAHHGRTGPGVSHGVPGTSFIEKLMLGPLTATSNSLYLMYRRYLKLDPRWRCAEENRRWQFGQVQILDGSKLSFVPKSRQISRTICSEPSLNMFFQLGIGALIEKRLKERYSIDLSCQPDMNRLLAMNGSVTGSFVTIDLESASDSISMSMLRRFLPRQVYAWLDLVRSPAVLIDGAVHQLHMVSTMGNGFTFPLQTAIFSCIVAAVHKFHGLALRRNRTIWKDSTVLQLPGNFGVFGDDIICSPQAAGDVLRLLKLLGFRVNSDKTFLEGPFRESCGTDFFKGVNIRGVYIKSLAEKHDRYVAFNRLVQWSAFHRIPLCRTLDLLFRSVERPFFVPCYEQIDSGFRVPLALASGFVRWNRRYQAYSYRRSVPDVKYLPVREGHVYLGKRWYLMDGCIHLLGAIQGSITPKGIPQRQNVVHRRSKLAYSSSWDYLPCGEERRFLPYKTADWKSVFLSLN
jgi:hypothetical protein